MRYDVIERWYLPSGLPPQVRCVCRSMHIGAATAVIARGKRHDYRPIEQGLCEYWMVPA